MALESQLRLILYHLSHKGSPRILECVAYAFCSGSSQPRNWTGVSCIAGGFFTNWAIWEARQAFQISSNISQKLWHKYGVVSVAQSCLTLCNPMDYSPPGSSVHGILQARILEWVAMSFSRGSSQPRNRTRISCFLQCQVGSLPLQETVVFIQDWCYSKKWLQKYSGASRLKDKGLAS